MVLTKISILLFCLRIFPNYNFRRWVKLTIAVAIFIYAGIRPRNRFAMFPDQDGLGTVGWNHTGKTFSEWVRPDISIAELDATDPEKGALFEIDSIRQGVNSTHIDHSSTHSADAVISLTSPMPAHLNNSCRHRHGNILPLQAKIIIVRKTFTVARDRDSGSSSILRPGSFSPQPKGLANKVHFTYKVADPRPITADSKTEETHTTASRREETPFSPTNLYSRQTDEGEDEWRKTRFVSMEKEFRTLSMNRLRSDDRLLSHERLRDNFRG